MRSLSLSLLMPLGLSLLVVGCNKPEAGNTATSNAKPVPVPAATLPEISKSATTTPPPPPGTGHPQAAAESRKAANPYAGLDENGIDIGLVKINEALKQFIRDTERLPKDLNELVKAGAMARLPTPPAGKKYAIDPSAKAVVLASQ